MDHSTTLTTVFDRVRSILATQSSRLSQYGVSDEEGIATEGVQLPSILPQTIPPLPYAAATLPEGPSERPLDEIAKILSTQVLPNLNLSSLSSRYYGFVTGGATPAALIADILASVYDQNAAVHLPHETIATNIEIAALNLLVDLFHLPKEQWAVGKGDSPGGGIITTGATASNVLGLALGREYVLKEAIRKRNKQDPDNGNALAVSVGQHGLLRVSRIAEVDEIIILSTLPHSSMVKAAGILGIGRANFISIAATPTAEDENTDLLKMDLDLLGRILSTAEVERKAYIVAVSAGEVNTAHYATTSFEQMQKIRSLCNQHGAWLHVDGAFGLFGRLFLNNSNLGCSIAKDYAEIIRGVQGLELADSITGDAHKLLNVPYDCGIFFTRHKTLSQDVFSNGTAAYLTSSEMSSTYTDHIQSPFNIGIENSRRFRALPVYTTLMAYGRQGYIDMLQRQIRLARRIVEWMYDDHRHESHSLHDLEVLPRSKSKDEAISKTFIGVLFRARDPDLNRVLVKKINATGQIYVTGTAWDGQPAARIAVSNWRVDIEKDFDVIKKVLREVLKRE